MKTTRIKISDSIKRGRKYYFLTLCTSCGIEKEIRSDNINQKCKCQTSKVGEKFGLLTVMEDACKRYTDGSIVWLCKCDCGNTVEVPSCNLTAENTQSCGCLHTGAYARKHGMSKTKFYGVWYGMRARCKYPNHISYKNYGGKGVTVCDEWSDFEMFYEDMYESYQKHKESNERTTIDRIDSCGNYEPSNCRWTSYKEQANNKREAVEHIPDEDKDDVSFLIGETDGIRITPSIWRSNKCSSCEGRGCQNCHYTGYSNIWTDGITTSNIKP